MSEAVDDVFIARQPIFDRDMNVHGYELLYRSGHHATANVIDGTHATSQVIINAFVEIGLATITDGRIAYINLTREYLIGELPLPFEPDNVVLEILEDIKVDAQLIEGLKALTAQGYLIALDDYTFTEDRKPLLSIVDIVKVDIMGLDAEKLRAHTPLLKQSGVKILAEKVETQEDLEICMHLGFDLFQGYFFSKPKVLSSKKLPANRITLLNLLTRLQSTDCEMKDLEAIISQDVTTSYKLLRILNSAYYTLPTKVDSIRRALVVLGMSAIRNWVTVITLTSIDDKPYALLVLSLTRARMCHLLCENTGKRGCEAAFITGLFSTLDALMDKPLAELLASLPLSDDVQAALLQGEGELGENLQRVLDYENGDWLKLIDRGIAVNTLRQTYFEALAWASGLSQHIQVT